ncbi:hypothetical protein D5S17_13835 [Pseudonocardiaceae bacterium YIM PH 21723]|nr:hypothetical protein D5S17_13835 [Pseudonocardiaceae bacterium YIM PH 21723]
MNPAFPRHFHPWDAFPWRGACAMPRYLWCHSPSAPRYVRAPLGPHSTGTAPPPRPTQYGTVTPGPSNPRRSPSRRPMRKRPEREGAPSCGARGGPLVCATMDHSTSLGGSMDIGLHLLNGFTLSIDDHRAVVSAHLAVGNRAAALRQYRQCRQVPHDELGVEPSETLHRLLPAH